MTTAAALSHPTKWSVSLTFLFAHHHFPETAGMMIAIFFLPHLHWKAFAANLKEKSTSVLTSSIKHYRRITNKEKHPNPNLELIVVLRSSSHLRPWLICAQSFPSSSHIFMQIWKHERSGFFSCLKHPTKILFSSLQKYLHASNWNIAEPPQKIFLDIQRKYFWIYRENIFGHTEKIFCRVWNNFYATRLTRCDRFGFAGFNPRGIFIVLRNLKHS